METKYLSDVINYENDIEPYQIIEIYSGVGSGKNYWVEKLASEGKSILFITSRKVTAQAQAKKMSGKRWIDLDALGQEGIGSKKQNLVVVTNAGLEHFVKEKYDKNNENTHIWKLNLYLTSILPCRLGNTIIKCLEFHTPLNSIIASLISLGID